VKRAIPLGRYTLGERLGVGGMGEVYLAMARGLGGFEKPLALKLLLPHLGQKQDLVERFLAEAHLAAKMNHVNVAQIFDVGTTDGRFFIAMELVRGVSLSALIKSLKRSGQSLPGGVVAFVARAVCDGLHHAHSLAGPEGRPLGVVHRDVTPHNILVSVDGAVKLTDFGIARAAGVAERAAGLYGKAAYVAPELLRDGAFDRRADLFSLGVTLFHLATLENPFNRTSQEDTLSAVTNAPLPPLLSLRPDVPAELAAAIERATAKDPAQRFDDARQMRDAMPAPPVDAADQLSKLVAQTFASDIDRLDARTRELVTAGVPRKTGTIALPDAQDETATPMPVPVPAERAGPPGSQLLIGGAAFAAMAGIVALSLFLLRHPPEPAAAPAPTLPTPPAVAVALPEPPAAVEEPEQTDPPPEVLPAPARHRHRPAPKPAPAPKSARTGYISIDATPWAEVRIDGKLIGETPIASFPVDADGKHEVELSNPDTKKQQRKTVKVAEGQRTFVKADLQ
jgi:serine/threonine protein kinase